MKNASYKFDLHVHTRYSLDCNTEVEETIRTAKKRGIDFIGITDHNTVEGWKSVDSKRIILGIEVSSKIGHILGLFIEQKIERGLSGEETVRRIHEQGGLAIAPHPFDTFRGGVGKKIFELNFDGIEAFNSKSSFLNRWHRKKIEKYSKAKIATSDAHFASNIGKGLTASKFKPKKAILENELEIIKTEFTSIPKNLKNLFLRMF